MYNNALFQSIFHEHCSVRTLIPLKTEIYCTQSRIVVIFLICIYYKNLNRLFHKKIKLSFYKKIKFLRREFSIFFNDTYLTRHKTGDLLHNLLHINMTVFIT